MYFIKLSDLMLSCLLQEVCQKHQRKHNVLFHREQSQRINKKQRTRNENAVTYRTAIERKTLQQLKRQYILFEDSFSLCKGLIKSRGKIGLI